MTDDYRSAHDQREHIQRIYDLYRNAPGNQFPDPRTFQEMVIARRAILDSISQIEAHLSNPNRVSEFALRKDYEDWRIRAQDAHGYKLQFLERLEELIKAQAGESTAKLLDIHDTLEGIAGELFHLQQSLKSLDPAVILDAQRRAFSIYTRINDVILRTGFGDETLK